MTLAAPHVSASLTADLTDEIYVGGSWIRGAGDPIESIDPSSGEVFATLHAATAEDVDTAVRSGSAAARVSGWSTMLLHERAAVLHRIGNAVEDNAGRIAAVQTLDTGKTLTETRALAMSAANTFRYMAAAVETMDGALTTPRGPWMTMSTHEPMGVIGAITPWNSPIASDAQKIAPALAAGNAVVAKPPVWAPWVTLLLARLCDEAGLPAGLLSVLPGPGRTVGETLVRHPGVAKVTFTGGTSTGRHLAHLAADKLMPITLELGGKSPTIVYDDADIERALQGVLYGIFSSSGQSCIAGSRIFLHRNIFESFTTQLVERAQRLRLGPGTDPSTDVAPMIALRHRDSVADMVDAAVANGATVLCGGAIPTEGALAGGAYYPPTVLTDVRNSDAICQEEIFGPVAVVLPFDDDLDLVEQANDSVYGLACGIWTEDYRRALRTAKSIDAGTVWINTYKQFSISTPFTGLRDSGLGTEKGRDAVRQYSNQKSIYLDLSDTPSTWGRNR
ncbi:MULTISPECIES: aldehyde dehydrogenase [Rhodococcus]|uniref:Aldehyde dehydrogenase n=1 Tax=Rhodococcus cerastii TaxID=908616 RepID=A0ABU4D5D0_9NOCA|nr:MULTISPECIES: aldehyde dehydrogenase [Rhodococcus]MDV6304504.1 aldehyde dehydrogenase [Rhodococcus cerastii]MDV8057941.1 aldehyde dehydrogenase [Rhodococcus sp. IEGM 1343]